MAVGRALCLLRTALHYRRDAFVTGLGAAGYEVRPQMTDPRPGDVLVLWNRYGGYHETATQWERAGGRVIVAENGYVGSGYYALALGRHAGAGKWYVGAPERWDRLGVELHPWRESDAPPLILGQRGIGEPGIASPHGWEERVRRHIGGRIRPHPGKHQPAIPLDQDILASGCVVTWASSAALRALQLGVPVWSDCPQWIGSSASQPLSKWGERPALRDDAARLEMFKRLAWAQWSLDEIRSGEAFGYLLRGVSI